MNKLKYYFDKAIMIILVISVIIAIALNIQIDVTGIRDVKMLYAVIVATVALLYLYFFSDFRKFFMQYYLIPYTAYEDRTAKTKKVNSEKDRIIRFLENGVNLSVGYSYPQKAFVEAQILNKLKKTHKRAHKVELGIPQKINVFQANQWTHYSQKNIEAKKGTIKDLQNFQEKVKS